MKHSFWLPGIKPISVNASYVRGHSGVVKSSAAREWTQEVCYQLSRAEHQDKLKLLREYVDPKLHWVRVSIWALYVRSDLITKQGSLSAKTIDVSNFEKSIIDVFFLPKFHTEPVPYGVPNVNCDDRIVAELRSYKVEAPERGLVVEIEVQPLASMPQVPGAL